jgi:hypothetical protein
MTHEACSMRHEACDAKRGARGGGDHQLRLDCQRRQLNLLNAMPAVQHRADGAASAKKIGFDKRACQAKGHARPTIACVPGAVWCSGPMARGEVGRSAVCVALCQTSARASMKTACVRACRRECVVCVNGWVCARISAQMRACVRACELEWTRACVRG